MAKSLSRRIATAPAKVKTSVTLSTGSFQRLGAAVVKEGMSQSEVVEWLIDRHLSGYSVRVQGERIGDSGARAAAADPTDRREAPDGVGLAAETAA